MNRGELYEALRELLKHARDGSTKAETAGILINTISDMQDKVAALWSKEAMWRRYAFVEWEHSDEQLYQDIYQACAPLRDLLNQFEDDGFDLSQLGQHISVDVYIAILSGMRSELAKHVIRGGLCGICHQRGEIDSMIVHQNCPIAYLDGLVTFYAGVWRHDQ